MVDPGGAADHLAAMEARHQALQEDLRGLEARINERLDRDQRGFDARLARLEPAPTPAGGATARQGRVAWDKLLPWVQALVTPVVVAVVGWWVSGSLDLAIKQQQADISGVKEMREALADLYAKDPEKAKVDTAADSIAAFGGVAAAPLIEAYNRGGAARPEAAKRGLIAAAVRDKGRVCNVLATVRQSADQSYTSDTHSLANELWGSLKC
jgi:hypothetical protein